ncbi:MAG: GntR family transcriptional regulator [Gemmatales bacterium]|nr:MAG: GntR family transcriptional regulator [Gemmatales bacterium]
MRVRLRPLKSQNLVAQAVETLRGHILSGKYAAGDELPSQLEMCESLGVSRSVVREAMQILQSQGLVEISQGRRPRVLPARPDPVIDSLHNLVQRAQVSLLHLVEIRRPLEGEAAALAAKNATPQLIVELRQSVEELANAEELDAQIAADVRFHRLLAEATANPLFVMILDVLAPMLHESRRQTLRQSGVAVALAYHRKILEAVEAGDAKLAREVMLQHMQRTKQDIEGFYN